MSKPWPLLDPEDSHSRYPRAPLARVAVAAGKLYGFGGVTPFALARVSRHSPEEVIQELEREFSEERIMMDFFLCTTIYLPVFYPYAVVGDSGRKPILIEFYDKDVEEERRCLEVDLETGEISEEDYKKALSQLLTWKELLERFGGPGWERKLWLNFNPWRRVKRFFPRGALRELRKEYLGGLPEAKYL